MTNYQSDPVENYLSHRIGYRTGFDYNRCAIFLDTAVHDLSHVEGQHGISSDAQGSY